MNSFVGKRNPKVVRSFIVIEDSCPKENYDHLVSKFRKMNILRTKFRIFKKWKRCVLNKKRYNALLKSADEFWKKTKLQREKNLLVKALHHWKLFIHQIRKKTEQCAF